MLSLLISACSSIQRYSTTNVSKDLSLTLEHDKKLRQSTISGFINGRVTTNIKPEEVRLKFSVGDNTWEPVIVRADGSFFIQLSEIIFQNQGEPPKILFKLSWEEELASHGQANKPTPDRFEYSLRITPDKPLELIDATQLQISTISITTEYSPIKDEARLKDIATERKRKSSLSYKKREIERLVEVYTKRLPSLVGQLVFVDRSTGAMPIERAEPIFTTHWLDSKRTKAKVRVILRGTYTRHISPTGFAYKSTADYEGGSFICESDNNGDWRISSTD
jgi:hypothetical protein